MTLNTAHSVGLSGIIMCIGIQNGGFPVELWRKETLITLQNCQQKQTYKGASTPTNIRSIIIKIYKH